MLDQNNISKTFCPAKWDELVINSYYNFVYSCCKAAPLRFEKEYKNALDKQKLNLLNNVQDSSCQYCWEVENNNKFSLRMQHLKDFNFDSYSEYHNLNKSIKNLEINLGNTCNLQCQYCNPKFSSEWEKDVRKKMYPIFTDRFVYEIVEKNKSSKESNFNLLTKENPETLTIIGGEPFLYKSLWEILDAARIKELRLTSNFMVDSSIIDRLLSYEDKFVINLNVSIDATKTIAEYTRHGLDFEKFFQNLKYYLKNSKSKKISISSLMTAVTVLDFENFYNYITDLRNEMHDCAIVLTISNCLYPKIQTFAVLSTEVRKPVIEFINRIKNKEYTFGLESLLSALQTEKFNSGFHKQFKYFINEWDIRKDTTLPKEIKELLCI
jgi:pyruvate-formate lyase-activating enzyme